MINNRMLTTLGLCRRAGKLTMGFDAVAEAIGGGKVFLLVLTQDLSPKSRKEISLLADKRGIPTCTALVTMDETQHVLGKRVGIVAVLDEGLANAVKAAQTRQDEEEERL